MAEIRFYHLHKQTLEAVLPKLACKAWQSGKRIAIRMADDKAVSKIDDLLWTYDEMMFLPHGSKKIGRGADQPIWISVDNDNPNNADMLIATQSVHLDAPGTYDLCCFLFNGRDETALGEARSCWKSLKNSDHTLTYWQQSDAGKWEQKS